MAYEDGLFKEIPKENYLGKDSFIIKSSPINGKGVFVQQEVGPNKDYYSVPLNDVRSSPSPSVLKVSSGFYINDPIILNFVNHSCNPNSELVWEQNKVVLRSKRRITAGEEITIDYCITEDQNTLIECRCGCENCRRFFFISA